MTARRKSIGDSGGFDPWNAGLTSSSPSRLLPLSTMLQPAIVETGFDEVHEFADFFRL